MKLFDDAIVQSLRPEVGREPVHFLGLGSHDFQIAFGSLRMQNYLRVDFGLRGAEYTWTGGPCAIPAWLLVDQVPNAVQLESGRALLLTFNGGDWIRLYTEENAFENQLFEWTTSKEVTCLEVF